MAAVLFFFLPSRMGHHVGCPTVEGAAAMKFTPIKGLVRLVMVATGVLIGLPFTKSFSFLVVCALLCTGWVFYWLVGGFFDGD